MSIVKRRTYFTWYELARLEVKDRSSLRRAWWYSAWKYYATKGVRKWIFKNAWRIWGQNFIIAISNLRVRITFSW